MKKQRLTLILLVLAMLTASCGSDAPDVTEDTTGTADTTTAAPVDPAEADALPSLNFGGEEVSILVCNYGGYMGYELMVEEATGDIVDDALYNRELAVEQRLNVKLTVEPVEFGWDDRNESWMNRVRNSILAGDSAFEILHGDGYLSTSFAAEGLLRNLSEYDYIDIEKNWWNKTYMDEAAVDDSYYCVTGDISLELIKSMFCMFVNNDLYDALNMDESLYQLVYDGKWTLDKAAEIASGCYADLNGDTTVDADDRHGLLLYAPNQLTGFMKSNDVNIIEKDGGEFEFSFGNAHVADVVERLCRFAWESDGIFYTKTLEDSKSEETVLQSPFRNGNILMSGGWLRHADTYRDLDFRYGVLPYPKWDEAADYQTTVLTAYTTFGIPADCKNPERAAAVLEAMAQESYKNVTPAYFETALKVKYASDDDTVKMFDIIRDGISFDFGYINTGALGGISDKFKDAIKNNKSGWMSTVESIRNSAETNLETLLAGYRGE